jgi:predicted RNA-binding Zn-ribbon protein involved in translation (DUF1610 family)
MKETGKSLHDSLLGTPKSQRGKCQSCGSSPMELYELDLRRSSKVMKCPRCGMLHVYKKDIIGKWRLLKAQKADFP